MVEALDGAQLLAIGMLTLLAVGAAWQVLHARRTGDAPPSPPERVPRRVFHLMNIADAFDPERAVLWESQVPALQLIFNGVPAARLFLFYARYPRQYPELFEDTTFEEWLQFLKRSNLITVEQGEIRLTAEGVEFLQSLRPTPALSGAGAASGTAGRSRGRR